MALVVIYLLLAWAGSAAVLAYERFDYEFTAPIDHLRLLGHMVSVGLFDVVVFYFTAPEFRLVNVVMLITAAVALMLARSSHRYRNKALVATSATTVPLGLVALSVIVTTVSNHDGEWLAEGWPILEVSFFWSVALVAFVYAQLRPAPRVDH